MTVETGVLDSVYVKVDVLDNVGLVVVLLPTESALPHTPAVWPGHAGHQTGLVLHHTDIWNTKASLETHIG